MKHAVIIIDVQNALVNSVPEPFEIGAVMQRINQVTRLARSKQTPVIFVQHEAPGTVLEHDSEGWQLPSELEVDPTDHIVRKTTPDSFLGTNLEELLKGQNIENLVIMGYASEFCVDSTVRRAAALDYNVHLVSDAHTTHDKNHACARDIRAHENATLPNITSFSATITSIPAGSIQFSS